MLLVSSRMRSCVTLPSPSHPAAASPCVRAWRGARPRSSIRSGRDGGSLRYRLRLPDPPPDLLGCQRHVEIGDAKSRERIEGRADDGGGGGGIAGGHMVSPLRTLHSSNSLRKSIASLA